MESGEIQREKGAPRKELPPSSSADPLIGTVIGDRYRVLELLGRGGMAAVYRAEHELLKKMVAIKLILPQLRDDADMVRRFEREAVAAGKLDHPNCVHVTDFGRTKNGRFFLVMEFLDGKPLADLLYDGERLEVGRGVAIARQILRGLSRAHELGILHRDLKASNIMLIQREQGREVAKIIDFGIAKMVGDADPTQGFKTEAGVVFGTADYLAPERLVSAPDIDGRVDLYSVGIIMYEMLTGFRPFHCDDAMEIVQRQLKERPKPPSLLAPDAGITGDLDAIVLRALEKDPRHRWPNAKAMLEALDGVKGAGRLDSVGDLGPPAASPADPKTSSLRKPATPPAGNGPAPAAAAAPADPGTPPARTPALPSPLPSALVKLVSAAERDAGIEAQHWMHEQAPAAPPGAILAPSYPAPTPTQVLRDRRRRFTRAGWAWLIGAPLVVILTVVIVLTRGKHDAGDPAPGPLPGIAAGQPLPPALTPAGPPDLAALAATAQAGSTVAERQEAFNKLVALGYRDRVDMAAKLTRDLDQLETCAERREVVQKLGRLEQPEVLGDLEKARQRADNACLRADADVAIQRLGGKAAPASVAAAPGAAPVHPGKPTRAQEAPT